MPEDNTRHIYVLQDIVTGDFYTSGSRDLSTSILQRAKIFAKPGTARRAATVKKNRMIWHANQESDIPYWVKKIEWSQERMNLPNRGVIIKHYVFTPDDGEEIEQTQDGTN